MSYEDQLRRLARVLSDIAQTLESVDDAQARIDHVLRAVRDVVPCRRCSLLEVNADETTRLFAAPAVSEGEERELRETLETLHRRVSRADDIGRSRDASPSLTLPLIGLDTIIGVIRVEPAEVRYDATHLRIFSIIAAQLGAYLTTLRLRELDRRRVEELAAVNAFQERLAAIVSHDLRNPLAVIMTVSRNLLDRAPDERQAGALRRALRSAERAARLIGDLLDVTESRVTGTIRIQPVPVDIGQVVEDCVDDLRSAHPQCTIELVLGIEPPALVSCDEDRVAQLLGNLVSNAVAHGAPGVPVEVALRSAGDSVAISVHNFGPAIPPELLPSIFDPFQRGSQMPHSQAARGLGLGLYIVAQIAKAHGGVIEVESSPTSGTMFAVHLPRVLGDVAVPSEAGSLVMVVDDDEDVRIGLAALLEDRGYLIECAANGMEALDKLRQGLRPRLVLLDLNMPGMDGEAFSLEVQRDPALAAIPIVLVSSDARAAVRVQHARAVLPKPVSADRLFATLQKIA